MKRKASTDLENDKQPKRPKLTLTLTRDPWKVIVKYLGQQEYAMWLLTHKGAKQMRFEGPRVRIFNVWSLPPPPLSSHGHWFWKRHLYVESLCTWWPVDHVQIPDFKVEADNTDPYLLADIQCRHLELRAWNDYSSVTMSRFKTTQITADNKIWTGLQWWTLADIVDLTLNDLHYLEYCVDFYLGKLTNLRIVFTLEPGKHSCWEGARLPPQLKKLELVSLTCARCAVNFQSACLDQNCSLTMKVK